MMQAADMFRTHPRQSQVEISVLAKCVDECYACAQTCTACADACLGEANVAELVRCIRLNEDCKAACLATGEMLSRVTEADWSVLRAQVRACFSHSAPHTWQAVSHARPGARRTLHSASVTRDSISPFARHAALQSSLRRMQLTSSATFASPRQASAQAVQV